MTEQITSIADIVRVHAGRTPDKTALIDGERRQSWAELNERASRVAQGLAASGVGSADRVVFFDKNCIEHFEVFFGAGMLNAVCVDPNWRLAAPEVQFIIDNAQAKVVVIGGEFVHLIDEIADQLPTVDKILVIGDHPTYQNYDEWVESFDAVDPHAPSAGSDIAFQLYSSGTTGLPKGVMLSNDNFLGLLPLAEEIWELNADSVNLAAMPLFHIGGGGWATAGMYHGCTTVIMRNPDPMGLAALIEEHRITHAFLVPALLAFMLFTPDLDKADLSSMEVVVYGASPISEDILKQSVALFGCKFWQAYGLTETTGAIVNLPPEDHDPDGPNAHRLRSCGVPGPGVELRIVDEDGNEVPEVGDVGEILVRSPQVMAGYWRNEAETEKAIVDGWFHTGDAGYFDADGYLYIHDRVKDMIVSGGENVYPAEVENVLMAHPDVADVAVIGVPDDKWGEVGKAIIVPVADADPDPEQIIAFARERLAGFKTPKSVDFVTELPRNPTGKILKKDLRAPFWEGRERAVN
jgi:long-chain acyl-CoA synthetase